MESEICNMKLFIKTFGCQMNTRDSEVIEGLFVSRGYEVAKGFEDADVILINTCSVRAHAEQRVFSLLGKFRALKRKRPHLLIGVVGCMAQNLGEGLLKRFPHIDFVCGPANIGQIPDLVDGKLRERALLEFTSRPEEVYRTGYRASADHAYIVISTGCNNRCSYCIVPYVRGPLVCRRPEDIIEEIKITVEKGISNITLLGQNVNDYQYKLQIADGGFQIVDFVDLLYMVHEIKGVESIGFITSHPKNFSLPLIEAMANLPKLRKYLHLPVQSGSDRILELMNRGYSAQEYREKIALYRQKVKGGVLTTDVIVGFPTETEEDFLATKSLLEEVRFDSAYIFKYSPRKGTGAYKNFKDDVPHADKKRRHAILLELQKEISLNKSCAKG